MIYCSFTYSAFRDFCDRKRSALSTRVKFENKKIRQNLKKYSTTLKKRIVCHVLVCPLWFSCRLLFKIEKDLSNVWRTKIDLLLKNKFYSHELTWLHE